MKKECENCKYKNEQMWNMFNSTFYSCEKGKSYAKYMFKKDMDCEMFSPSEMAIKLNELKREYAFFIHDNNIEIKKHLHYWTIVNERYGKNSKKIRYKRISGNHSLWLKFHTEQQLEQFYTNNSELIKSVGILY